MDGTKYSDYSHLVRDNGQDTDEGRIASKVGVRKSFTGIERKVGSHRTAWSADAETETDMAIEAMETPQEVEEMSREGRDHGTVLADGVHVGCILSS